MAAMGSVTGSSVRIFFGLKNLFCLQYNFTVENVIIFKNIFSDYISDRTLDPSTEPKSNSWLMRMHVRTTCYTMICDDDVCAHA